MQCERCNKKKATVFYRENIGGKIRALRLCGECAELLERAGELEDMSTALSGVFSPLLREDEGVCFPPFGVAPSPVPRNAACKCPACGALLSEIAATGRVGCAACYTAFEAELRDLLIGIHGRVFHRGRVSAGYRARKERLERMEDLRQQLRIAVEAEEYERAAGLRDEIRGLEAAL